MMWTVYSKNGVEKCEIHSLEYNGTFMGEKYITATIKSPYPIEFAIGDYVIYRDEQFTLNYDPSIIKKASLNSSGDAFVYENVKFNSYSDELVRCQFLDYVLNDNLIHFSSLPSFGFHALTIHDLADRIKANLDRVYTGDRAWTVTVNDSNINVTNVFITADRLNVWDALALVSTVFKSNFIIRGRTITIGTAGNVIDNVFEYGKGKGLNKITRIADSEQQIITRLRVYGSTRNLPARYYNKLTKPDLSLYIPNNMAVQNLMLPSFPYETLDPYIDSPNIGALGVMEGSVFFDGSDESLPEIYPSLEGMTASQLSAAGIIVNLDSGDNGNLDEIAADSVNSDGTPITDDGIFEEGETVPSFKITLKDIGFDINDYLSGETATISMKSGLCGGREFEILSCEKVGNKYILTCNRFFDDGIGLYFPYGAMNIKAGDKFVLLNIEMPVVYIQAASQRLLEAGQEYLSKNDYVRYTYSVDISPVYMARNPILHDTIVEGDYLQFADTDLGIAGSIIIDNLRIKEGDEIIPTYEVTLTEEKQVGTIQKIQNQINYLLSGAGGSILDVKQTESLIRLIGDRQFLSKVSEDTAQKLIKFLEGIEVGTFASGLLGSGAAIKNVNGTSVAEVDQLLVRQRAEFFSVLIHEARSVGGQLIISAANMLCTKVEETTDFYRCYFDSKDGEVANLFSTSDFARCQIFTGTRQKFYWRKVVAVGTDYIELSKTDAALNSDIPEVGDTIFQLGSTDVNRQGAMILSTVGNDAPSFIQYSGINSYDLTGKETTKFTRLGNRIVGSTVFLSSGFNLDEWADGTSSDIQDAQSLANQADRKAQQAIEDAEANVGLINTEIGKLQAQIDGEVSNWFYPYSPTLANYPASDWTTDEIKDRHIGDTFTNTQTFVDNATTPDAGKSWRFVKNGTVYSWTQIADSDAVLALQKAAQAQATADGKSTTFLIQPTSYKLGDMWVLNADRTINGTAYKQGEILTATQDSTTFNEAHWLKRVRYTDDTAVDNLQIGGRNLFLNTSPLVSVSCQGERNQIVYLHYVANNRLGNNNIQIGDYVTFSCEFELETNGIEIPADAYFYFRYQDTNNTWNNLSTYYHPSTIGTSGRIVVTKTVDQYLINLKYNTVRLFYLPVGTTLKIWNIQLERGNKASYWTPAPEDVEASIETAKAEAESAAKAYADTKAEAERVIAEAYADGKVSAEEQARIDDVNAKLAAAKAYADAQDALLKAQQEAYVDGEISASEQATIDAAKAYADLKKTEAQAYADGIVDAEEQRAIADAQAKFNEAKAHAESLVDNLEIGGRNLIKNTDLNGIPYRYDHINKPSEGGLRLSTLGISEPIIQPYQYTISMEIRGVSDVPIIIYRISSQGNSPIILIHNTDLTEEYKKVKLTFTPHQPQLTDLFVYTQYRATAYNAWFEIKPNSLKLEKGNKATDWAPAPEDVQAEIDAAQLAAEAASAAAGDANTAVGNLNGYVDGAFKDGVIEASEAKAIEKYINVVNTEKANLEATYNTLYANTYLEGTAKTNLLNAKITYFGAVDTLINSINTAITDGKTTVAEKQDVDAKYSSYKTALASLQTAIENANKAIQTKLDTLSTQKVNNLQIGGRNLLRNSLVVTDRTYPSSGVVDMLNRVSTIPLTEDEYVLSFEAKSTVSGDRINCYFYNPNTTTRGESSLGGVTTVIDGNISLVITNEWEKYWIKYTQSATTTVKYVIVGRLFAGAGSGTVSIRNVKLEKGNKATDWTPAPEDVQAEIDDAKQEALTAAGNAQNTANSLKDFTDTAFRDGIIDRSESVAIEKYKNSLNEAMAKAEASYNKVYTNTYLEGAAKTSLLNAKINLWGQRDTLLSAINTAISGGTTTPAQKTAVDNAFSTFNNLMTAFQNALEEANKAIQAKLDALSTEKVENIEIGGRNLLISSNLDRLAENFTYNTTKHLKARINYYFNFIVELEPNTEYVVSNKKIIHDGSGEEPENTLRLVIYNEALSAQKQAIGRLYSGSSISFKTNSNITQGDKLLFYPTVTTQIDFEVLELKLEKGNKATDWTPAPEDVQAEIDAAVVKATYWSIKSSAPVIYKNAPDAITSGTHTSVTVSGELRSGTTTTQGGFITVTPNDGTEPSTATASPVTIAPAIGDGKTSYTVRLYDTASKTTLLDTLTIPVVFKGASGVNAINVILSNEADILPASPEGVVSDYSGSGTTIRVFEGATELDYDGVGTANGKFNVTATSTGITVGTKSESGLMCVFGNASNMTLDNAMITFTISGKTQAGTSFSITKTQSFSKARTGQKGDTGASAPLLYLSASAQVMKCNPDNTPQTGQTITFEAKLQNVTGTATFTATPYNDAGVAQTPITLGGGGNTRTLTNSQWLAAYKRVEVVATLGSLTDKVTIYRVTDGASGRGISSTDVTYQVGSSGTTAPTGTWLSTIPTVPEGQYLWTRTVTTYTDNTTSTSYSVSRQAPTGAAGRGISSTVITYQSSASGTVIPGGTWSSTIPSVAENEYLWTRTVITYTDSTTSTSYSVGKMGAKGDAGQNAIVGLLTNESVTLQANNAGTVSSFTPANGEFWVYNGTTRVTTGITFSKVSNTGCTATINSSGAYSVSAMTADNATAIFRAVYNGVTIEKTLSLSKSKAGADGVSITLVDVEFAKNTNPTTPPTTGWTTTAPTLLEGEQLWTRTKTTYSSGSPTYTTPANITPKKGDVGTGIESVTEEYAISTSKTVQPTSGWSTTQPTWEQGKYIWSRVKVVYKNPSSTVYTGYAVSSEWEAVNNLEIGGRNLLLNSSEEWVTVTTTTDNYINNFFPETVLEAGQEYTFSWEAEIVSGTPSGVVHIGCGTVTYQKDVLFTNVPIAGKNKITFKPTESHLASGNKFAFRWYNNGAIFTFRYRKLQLEKGSKATDWTPAPEDVQAEIDAAQETADEAQLAADGYMKARYVRDWIQGSTLSTNNVWREINVIRKDGTNVAQGKIPSSNGTFNASYPAANATDNNINTYAQINGTTPATSNYVQIDLGQVYNDIDYIQVWHDYTDGRTFYGTKTEISVDGVTWTTIYDSATMGTYKETIGGKTHSQRYNRIVSEVNRSKAITDKFGTRVDGGLISTVITEYRELDSPQVTGLISGIQGTDKNLPFLVAGGTYNDALSGTAKAIIRHDGTVKFTDGEFHGTIYATDGEFTGTIHATRGTIGGFDISSGRIGKQESDYGGLYSGLALYNDFIKFSDDNTWVGIGTNVLPAIHGNIALGRFENHKQNQYGINLGILINVTNGRYNKAIGGVGDILMEGTVQGYKYYHIVAPVNTVLLLYTSSTNAPDFTKVVVYFNSNSAIELPSRYDIADRLNINSSTPFAIRMTIICDKSSAYNGTVYGRMSSGTFSSSKYPKLIDNDGAENPNGYGMGKGDIFEFMLVYNGSSDYSAYILNNRK